MALPPPVILLEAPPFPWRPNLLPMPPEYRYYIDAPDSPSPLSLLDTWARTESYILSPMLRVTHDASSTGSGFAVVTRRPVPQGHALMRVPARLSLTADGAVRALPRLLSRELEAHVSIAVWLMRLVEAPPKSLAPYLRSLRRDAEVDCALMWTDEEVDELEPWTVAHARAMRLRRWAKQQWRTLLAEEAASARPVINASVAEFEWAVCAVWSRSFSLRCAEPSCGGAAGVAGADAGTWRVMAPVADLLNHAPGATANSVLIQPESGFDPAQWRQAKPSLEDESAATARLVPPPVANGTSADGETTAGAGGDGQAAAQPGEAADGEAAATATATATGAATGAGGATTGTGNGGVPRSRTRARARRARARARSLRAKPRTKRGGGSGGSSGGGGGGGSGGGFGGGIGVGLGVGIEGAAYSFSSSPSAPSDGGALAEGVSDYALGGGGGVWMWRDHLLSGGGGPVFAPGMDVAGSNWMQRVCYHALCIPEPDTEGEAWDAISAVRADTSEGSLVVRATRDLDAGEEVVLDYGPRPNAELVSTHGFALAHNAHDVMPLSLSPSLTDETGAMKARILAAGNLSSPYRLSPRLLRTDSDVLLALRIIAATPTELQRYADAFGGKPLSARNEHKWRRLLRSQLAPLLSEAERLTTADDDRRLLRQARVPPRPNATRPRLFSRSERRRRTAILARLGEKQLLRDVIADLDKALEKKVQPEAGVPKAVNSEFKVA